MGRIAVGGIQHETNVFAPYKAEYAVFAQRDEWPPLSRGEKMLDNVCAQVVNAAQTSKAQQQLVALAHQQVTSAEEA